MLLPKLKSFVKGLGHPQLFKILSAFFGLRRVVKNNVELSNVTVSHIKTLTVCNVYVALLNLLHLVRLSYDSFLLLTQA